MEDLGAFRGLPQAIQLLVESSNKSKSKIAEEVGIHRTSLYRYFDGKMFPQVPVLGRLLEVLEKDATHLAEALAIVQGRAPSDEAIRGAIRLLTLRLGVAEGEPGSTHQSESRG